MANITCNPLVIYDAHETSEMTTLELDQAQREFSENITLDIVFTLLRS